MVVLVRHVIDPSSLSGSTLFQKTTRRYDACMLCGGSVDSRRRLFDAIG